MGDELLKPILLVNAVLRNPLLCKCKHSHNKILFYCVCFTMFGKGEDILRRGQSDVRILFLNKFNWAQKYLCLTSKECY